MRLLGHLCIFISARIIFKLRSKSFWTLLYVRLSVSKRKGIYKQTDNTPLKFVFVQTNHFDTTKFI